jgi:hypothetical protein
MNQLEYVPDDKELEEREVTLKGGEIVKLDDISQFGYIGKNYQVTLAIEFNPRAYSSYNKYTHKYEEYISGDNLMFLVPTIDDDYIEFPDE